jgi:lipopolysaccharide/colanic/teichoic acid biosynthesis glycosyltransferase
MHFIYSLFVLSIFLLLLPVFLIFGLLLLFVHGKPIIFCQKRIGFKGKPFIMYKFRTMVPHADRLQKKIKARNEADGPVFKIYNDPRYTRIGKFLSHTGLDELPQVYNVLRGDMALFGPRPLPVAEARKLTRKQQKRQLIKPGIFSPWILEGYHRRKFNEWMESDLRYIQQKSLSYDVVLFFRGCLFLLQLFFHEIFRSKGKLKNNIKV